MIKYTTVLVSFPFDDLTGQKVRPALCLIEPVGKFEHVIVAFISSKIPNEFERSDFLFDINDSSFINTGLLKNSILRLHKVATIPRKAIKRKLGELDIKLQLAVKQRILDLYLN